MTETTDDIEAGLTTFDDSLDYVTVTVGGQLLGLPIERVQDVFIATRITPVPLAPPEIIGLINLRGRVVTAISMRKRMGWADMPAGHTGADEGAHRMAGRTADIRGGGVDVPGGSARADQDRDRRAPGDVDLAMQCGHA